MAYDFRGHPLGPIPKFKAAAKKPAAKPAPAPAPKAPAPAPAHVTVSKPAPTAHTKTPPPAAPVAAPKVTAVTHRPVAPAHAPAPRADAHQAHSDGHGGHKAHAPHTKGHGHGHGEDHGHGGIPTWLKLLVLALIWLVLGPRFNGPIIVALIFVLATHGGEHGHGHGHHGMPTWAKAIFIGVPILFLDLCCWSYRGFTPAARELIQQQKQEIRMMELQKAQKRAYYGSNP